MMFSLSLPNGLNERLHPNITYDALLDKPLVLDPESNTSNLSSSISTYRGEEIESMLGYIDQDIVVYAT